MKKLLITLFCIGIGSIGRCMSFYSSGGGGSSALPSVGSTTTVTGALVLSTATFISSATFNGNATSAGIVLGKATANVNGFYFDPACLSGQGCWGIGAAPSNKLDVSINSGTSQVVQFENQATGGYASWRAKANGTTETVDYGVGGNSVGGSFQDYGFINTGAGLLGERFFTNAGSLVMTLANDQTVNFSTGISVGPAASKATVGGLDLQSGGVALVVGANNNSQTRTAATTQMGRIAGVHQDATEEPIGGLVFASDTGANTLSIGGGSVQVNAATTLNFYTALTTTTTSGTVAMTINGSQAVTMSSTTALTGTNSQFSVTGSTQTGAGTALLSTNCPASSASAPAYWMRVRACNTAGAGCTNGYFPIWQ